jgi:hypothetical protein
MVRGLKRPPAFEFRFFASVMNSKFVTEVRDEMQVPFGFAQGRLSTPLKNASLRMTASFKLSD